MEKPTAKEGESVCVEEALECEHENFGKEIVRASYDKVQRQSEFVTKSTTMTTSVGLENDLKYSEECEQDPEKGQLPTAAVDLEGFVTLNSNEKPGSSPRPSEIFTVTHANSIVTESSKLDIPRSSLDTCISSHKKYSNAQVTQIQPVSGRAGCGWQLLELFKYELMQ